MTTAYISRNHGYMIYDTLFSVNDKFEPKPQMVEKYEVSPDKLTYTFTLRDGLKFHNGKPVTSEDCIRIIKRYVQSHQVDVDFIHADQNRSEGIADVWFDSEADADRKSVG